MNKKKTNRDKLKEVFNVDLDKDDDFYIVQYNEKYTDNCYEISTFLNDWLNAEYKDNGYERYISELKSKIKFLNTLVELTNDLYEEYLEDNEKLRKQIEQMKKAGKKKKEKK